MSTAIAKNFQVGTSGTATDNFTIRQPATPDGTVRIANGNSGTTNDLVTVTSAGNLGVGTSSPESKLDVGGAGSLITLRRASDGSGTGKVGSRSGSEFSLYNGGGSTSEVIVAGSSVNFNVAASERMRIDSSGNLGLGITPSAWDTLRAFDIGSGGGVWGFAAQAGLGSNVYYGTSNFRYKATNVAAALQVDGNVFKFLTAPSGTAGNAISFTQAMTLDSSGNLRIGTTGNVIGSGERLSIQTSNSNSAGVSIKGSENYLLGLWNSTVGSSNLAYFFAGTGASFVGSISTNGSTSTSYNTSSDYRLKNAIAPMTGALAKVAALKPVTYKWNADGSDGQGFIAHELAEVVPDAVTGAKDAVDEEGKPVYQGIDTSFLVATLTAAIQELKAEFDAYKATHP